MIDCNQIIAQLSDYLDGEVSPEMKQVVESHLAKCHRCSIVYSTTRQTLKIVTECGAFAIPAAVGTRLHSRLRELFAAR
jgi:predicted anti-sigma-YlaC factor YlaD